MSQSKINAIFFYEKGYRVTAEGVPLNPKGRILKGHTSAKDGRLHITTTYMTKNIRCPVHALAAYELFGEPALNPNVHIRHLNGNPLDNSASNLAIGTSTDNHLDVPAAARTAHALKGARTVRKLTYEQAQALREAYSSGSVLSDLANNYCISLSAASYIVNNKTYITGP